MKRWIVGLCSLGLLVIGPSEAKASLFTYLSLSSDLNLAIPEANVNGVDVLLDTTSGVNGPAIIPGTEKIVDISLFVNLTHTWMGDLAVSLGHGGKKLVVMARPRESQFDNPVQALGGPFGDGSNLLGDSLGFSDSFLTDPEVLGAGLDGDESPAGPSELFPNPDNFASDYSSFLGFVGQDPAGIWTINISDWAGGDVGTLNDWELDILTEHGEAVPEPASLLLIGSGLAVAGIRRRFGRKSA